LDVIVAAPMPGFVVDGTVFAPSDRPHLLRCNSYWHNSCLYWQMACVPPTHQIGSIPSSSVKPHFVPLPFVHG
jgi:hypothetical protein